ncbi:MAG: hypothetical protein ACM3ON_03845, partial [Chloroflexota bacterium]
AQASRFRKQAARIAAFFFFIIFATVLDGCIAKFREPINVFDLLPGSAAPIDGPAEDKAKEVDDLAYTVTSPHVTVTFDLIQTGFWFGGNMWVGTLSLAPDIAPGEYDLKVFPKETGPQKPTSVFKVRVYKDYASYRTSFKSLIRRYLDISPWWFLLACLPFLGVSLGCVYLLSQKIEVLMAQQGKAEVYMVKKTETGYDIGFALGTRHGVGPGSQVSLCDESGRTVGTVTVRDSTDTDSVAAVGADVTVRQGYVVTKEGR